MFDPVLFTLMAAGLLLAAWSGLWAYLRRPVNTVQWWWGAVLTGLLTVQSVVAWVRLIGPASVPETVTFIAYSAGVLIPLPVGLWMARLERTRWGSVALASTAVVVAVMLLRLWQLWRAGSA
ncbi:hypothetical protein [Nakamurella aerolata]|uniref:Uncharacterized protein n=1 Tax=Nakamurella aerolata TaxID=1656892 RepID=A0A849A9Z4_9ACTN|nr:hypothetical protein [Nakamurella aerolata]NNG35928.1 hypothetical protein [Nakamurella aerolata]